MGTQDLIKKMEKVLKKNISNPDELSQDAMIEMLSQSNELKDMN